MSGEDVSVIVREAFSALRSWSKGIPSAPYVVEVSTDRMVPVAYADSIPARIVLPHRLVTSLDRSRLFADVVHEAAHVVLFCRTSHFLSEGFAVAASVALADGAAFPCASAGPIHRQVAELAPAPGVLTNYFARGCNERDWQMADLPHEGTRVAYLIAGSFVGFLLEQDGHERFRALIARVNAGSSEAAALEELYASPLVALEARWLDFLTSLRPGLPGIQQASAHDDVPLEGTEWVLADDRVVGGDSHGTLSALPEGFALMGELGAAGPIQFLTASRFLRTNRGAVSLRARSGVSFEARGDGKNYQLGFMTEQAKQPGQEFSYLFATQEDWQAHRVPFARLVRLMGPALSWTGDDVLAVKFRAFGYRRQRVQFEVRAQRFF